MNELNDLTLYLKNIKASLQLHKCFQICYIYDKIALEGWNLLEHTGILSLELPSG